jgi:hypothetical protein
MPPDRPNHATGYPPVKPAEKKQARETTPSKQEPREADGGSAGLTSKQRIITDAVSAVMEKHRAEIASAPVAPETRQYALDLLDAVLLDILQTVLNEASALDLLVVKRGSGP